MAASRMTDGSRHPADVAEFLDRLYSEEGCQWACRVTSPSAFRAWQTGAREAFRDLLGLTRIEAQAGRGRPMVEWAPDTEDLGDCTRQQGRIDTEPSVRTSFWCLRPKGEGPFPLAITPHGHENGDIYAGICTDEKDRRRMQDENRDVAVEAARRGFLAIAPATRGIGGNPRAYRIADIGERHGGRDCVCHNWQVAVVGRSALGERVWDLMRILDWALALPEVSGPALMLGNSGGGMATAHAAACDERIDMAVPCCAFNNYRSPAGTLRHCPCNAVPGLLSFGEFWDVAGLTAPRPLLTVNGRHDGLHPTDEVDAAVSRLTAIYDAAGATGRYQHSYGEAGHRFYADIMWPWVETRVAELSA